MRDPYSVLGIPKIASSGEIKSAFRRQAKASHPDSAARQPQPEIPFSDVLAAYEILGNEERRRQYDLGLIDAEGRKMERSSMFRNFASGMPGFGFSKPAGKKAPQSDADREDQFVKASHEEIMERIFGEAVARTLHEDAPAMDNQQGQDGVEVQSFSSGDVHVDAFVPLETALRKTPMDIRLPSGRVLAVKVPAGIEREPVVRLAGQGEIGAHGRSGDVLIRFRFKKHAHLRLDGIHLICELPVPLHQGITGAKIPVETLDGRILVSLPPWSGSDRVLRIGGKGLPDHAGKRGDLFVHVRLMLPETPDEDLLAYAKSGAPAS